MRQIAIILVILAAAFSAAAQTEEPTPAPFVYSAEPAELKLVAATPAATPMPTPTPEVVSVPAAKEVPVFSGIPEQMKEVPVFSGTPDQMKKLSRWQRFNLAVSSFFADGLSGASYRPYSYRPYSYRYYPSYRYRPVYVRSYIRRDGTYVRSHRRSR